MTRSIRALLGALPVVTALGCRPLVPTPPAGPADATQSEGGSPRHGAMRSDTLIATGPCLTGGPFASTAFGPIFDAPQQGARLLTTDVYPHYPSLMQTSGKPGRVRARFVIDDAGEVELMSAEILESTHPHFSIAVCQYLTKTRYVPAVHEGIKVRNRVEQEFYFQFER